MSINTMARASGRGSVLITGATGFIGTEVLARYLQHDDRRVIAIVRGRDGDEATARLRHVLRTFFGDEGAHADRVRAVPGDIEQPGLGMDPRRRALLAQEVTDIVHSAASVSFSLPLRQSRDINVEGTRQMLEFGQLCERRGGLRRFSYISTAYVAGNHHGAFGEDDLDVGQSFRNAYERSKFEAEQLVRSYMEQLPIQIFRPSIVVGEQSTGWTSSFNVLYSPLKAFEQGMLPALPARRSAPVDVVPVDYVADAVFHLSNAPENGATTTYHLVAGDRATTVGRLIDMSAARVGRRKPVVIPPRLFRRMVYPVISRGGRERVRRGLKRSEAFFPYFAMDVNYDASRAREQLEPAGISVPPIESYFDRLVGYATRAQWGRQPVSRAEAGQQEQESRSATVLRAGP
jgi:thioester reductase-like protein